MRGFIPLLGACLALAGCVSYTVYHKPGVSVQRWQDDTLACRTRALRDAPVAETVRQQPDRFIPPRRWCDSRGHCHYEGGYWVPGRIYSVDVNKTLRSQIELACMSRRGYIRTELPQCPAETPASAIGPRLPPLTEGSCGLRASDGRVFIVGN